MSQSDDIPIQRRIELICREFEEAWSHGNQPEVESYFERVPEEDRQQLMEALARVTRKLHSDIEQPTRINRFNIPEAETGIIDSNGSTSNQIGPYKLLQQIGEGGMGTVWMADQLAPIKRRVALKVIKAGMNSKQVIARFEAERQALAMMDHQNIAKVLDAGTTENGQPYFAMELVQGIPFTDYCNKNKLSLRERLQLFVPVCNAVQHAHQKGIIHRDLKPSNVLVTLYDGKPVPKVIDFGLAKALQHQVQLTDKTMFTEFGQVIGTLRYMSPEQAEMNSMDVDTRTDIYSLGVMLYELLTGSTPLEAGTIKKDALLHVLQLIKEKEPPRPSLRLSGSSDTIAGISDQRKITPNRLQQILRGELDWVVMRALEKDRTRRYETANGFAMDIQRYLEDEPVEARPQTGTYRLRKYMKKNRGLVATAAIIAIMLIVGITISSWFAFEANIANRKAQDANKQLVTSNQKLKASLTETRTTIDHYVETVTNTKLLREKRFQPTLQLLLADALGHYSSFVQQHNQDLESLGHVADSLKQVAAISRLSGDVKAAVNAGVLEIELREKLLANTADELDASKRLAKAWNRLANNHEFNNHPIEAEIAHNHALRIYEKLIKTSDDLMLHLDHTQILVEFARHHATNGKLNEARIIHENVDAILEKLAIIHSEDPDLQYARRNNYQNHAICLIRLEQATDALEMFKRTLDISSRLAESDPRRGNRFNKATDLYNLAHCLADNDKIDESLPRYLESATMFEELLRDKPLSKINQSYLADTYQKMGQVYVHRREFDEALNLQRRAIALHEELVESHPFEANFTSRLANHLNIAGGILDETGRSTEALLDFQKALELIRPITEQNPTGYTHQRRLAIILRNQASALAHLDRFGDALASYVASAEVVHRALLRDSDQPDFTTLALDIFGDIHELSLTMTELGDFRELYSRVAEMRKDLGLDSNLKNSLETARMLALSSNYRSVQDLLSSVVQTSDTSDDLLAEDFYAAACTMALTARSGSIDDRMDEQEKLELETTYGDQSMEFLKAAQARGFFDEIENRQRIHDDPDLESLRNREDFRELISNEAASRL